MEEIFFLYSLSDHEWVIEKNKTIVDSKFESFDEGENFLKRNYAAWLVRDDTFVKYLMDGYMSRVTNKR
jgi:hypothetical protein